MSDQEPPRKRSRASSPDHDDVPPGTSTIVTSDVGMLVGGGSAVDSASAGTRDKDYYFSDGNCVLLVESTLFNVHRSILSRDTSTFSELFALPQGEGKEGSSDIDPIVLQGDTANEFRNFLWAMYALPHEHRMFFDNQSNIPKLLDIVKVSHKYCLTSLETWACDGIDTNLSRRTFSFAEADSSNRTEITNILRFAASLGHHRLIRAVTTVLKEHFTSSPVAITFVLKLCHELESEAALETGTSPLGILLGEAYFSAVLRGPTFWDAPETCLASQTKIRMLMGYYRLSQEWVRIQTKSAPWINHDQSCHGKSRGKCNARWKEVWEQKILSRPVAKLGPVDIRKKLRVVQSEIDSGNMKNWECKEIAKGELQVKIIEFEEKLADFFLKA